MNHAVVVDASIPVKVVIAEEFSERAEALIRGSRAAHRSLLAPPIVMSEVTTAVHKQVQQRSITAVEADQALSQFLEIPISLVSSPELYQRAMVFAREHRLRHVYDSIYAMLSHRGTYNVRRRQPQYPKYLAELLDSVANS
jgi:predicted nucleic acid-binding protein